MTYTYCYYYKNISWCMILRTSYCELCLCLDLHIWHEGHGSSFVGVDHSVLTMHSSLPTLVAVLGATLVYKIYIWTQIGNLMCSSSGSVYCRQHQSETVTYKGASQMDVLLWLWPFFKQKPRRVMRVLYCLSPDFFCILLTVTLCVELLWRRL